MSEVLSEEAIDSDAATATPGSIFDEVGTKIGLISPDDDTLSLWVDIRAAFDEGGPAAVKCVIEERVKQSRLAVEKDLRQTRSVTKSATPKRKTPAKKAATRRVTRTK